MKDYNNTIEFLKYIKSLSNDNWLKIRNCSIRKYNENERWYIQSDTRHQTIFYKRIDGRFKIDSEMAYLCDRLHGCYAEKDARLRINSDNPPNIDSFWSDFIDGIVYCKKDGVRKALIKKPVYCYYEVKFLQDICILNLCRLRDPIFEHFGWDLGRLLVELQDLDTGVYSLTSEIAQVVFDKGFDGLLYVTDRNPSNGTLQRNCLAFYNSSIQCKIESI